jgi:hypothetical protein
MYFSPSWYCLLAGKGRFTKPSKALSNTIKYADVADIDSYCEQNAKHFKSHQTALNDT